MPNQIEPKSGEFTIDKNTIIAFDGSLDSAAKCVVDGFASDLSKVTGFDITVEEGDGGHREEQYLAPPVRQHVVRHRSSSPERESQYPAYLSDALLSILQKRSISSSENSSRRSPQGESMASFHSPRTSSPRSERDTVLNLESPSLLLRTTSPRSSRMFSLLVEVDRALVRHLGDAVALGEPSLEHLHGEHEVPELVPGVHADRLSLTATAVMSPITANATPNAMAKANPSMNTAGSRSAIGCPADAEPNPNRPENRAVPSALPK